MPSEEMLDRRLATNGSILSIITFCLAILPAGASTNQRIRSDICISPFRIVIDAGSTGSRLHIFEFTGSESSRFECLRRGSSKAWTPLSAFAPEPMHNESKLNATHVAHHMLPLFDYASIIIPQQYHQCTSVTIAATAGMRLLSQSEQEIIYDALYEGLIEYKTTAHLESTETQFAFAAFRRNDVYTLNGEQEGFFGAVAANYLRGVIDAQLKVIVHDDDENEPGQMMLEERLTTREDRINDKGLCTNKFGMCEQDAENVVFGPSHHYTPQKHHDVKAHGPLGALDMGGSSTQIVYRSKAADTTNSIMTDPEPLHDVPSHLHHDDFYAVSYLSYGADQFRVRLWDLWVDETKRTEIESNTNNVVHNNVILNPCSFVGYSMEYRGYTLLGSGDAVQCSKEVNRLIPYHDDTIDLDELYDENMEQYDDNFVVPKKKLVGGVEHPPIRGKFYGMSLYFFTLDCLRELSDEDHPIRVSWPTPSIEELTHALDTFCARKWQGDLEEVQHEAHEHTRAEVLPHRCIEAVYMVTLLRDGFGFHPSSRDITFTQYVQGNEVEWSLGLALQAFAEERKEYTAI